MKTLLLHVALTALGTVPMTNVSTLADVSTKPTVTIHPQPLVHINSQPTARPVATVTKTAMQNTAATPVATKPAFDAHNSATWPSCPTGDIVRADNGQCAAPAAPAAALATPASAAPVYSAPVSYSGSHQDWMAAAGISPSDYTYVDYIVTHESGWNYLATNPSSGAYGLCQALPGGKMASAGADWQTNPITQLRWCNSYAQAAHGGGWYNCYLFWLGNSWW